MKQQDKKQQGFALIESMIAMVVFAILLVALLNYSQYITLNFNWIFRQSAAIRELQSNLERKASMMDIESKNTKLFYPDWQINLQTFAVSENCTDTTIALSTARQTLSLSRWFCRTGDNNVPSLSF
ncbi:prepilin-type N-terminal cleavage/methylation domain-containing protein [Providencia burhodogranariea]|uniref:Prepilin peptidase dependent protein C n=1 Tax=Providencia burhodogranariea DSM 19968 TaxID=1141662 RepID=K8WL45_9GAMM|nr:prepilin-type N-terminal cleavage/methylation domain-containing protein [Providencia burhodogranariea]EKT58207.1 prepilin peptidase dependent protein C [Providencia burhodogranariea DSM 19968]